MPFVDSLTLKSIHKTKPLDFSYKFIWERGLYPNEDPKKDCILKVSKSYEVEDLKKFQENALKLK